MCGRFYFLGDEEAVQAAFPQVVVPWALGPRYNIAPHQPVAVIANDGKRQLDHFLWGLVPSWSKDPRLANRLINVRVETLLERPTFRTALHRRRCLIPADGFYEWYAALHLPDKIPLAFRLDPPRLFAFAGIWDVWYAPDASVIYSCAIITTAANAFMAPYHARMPVILDPAHYDAWLDPDERSPQEMLRLLQPFPPAQMAAHPVSTTVNNARVDAPVCLEPVGEVVRYVRRAW